MGTIVQTDKDEDGNLWGFDRDENRWVPLDEAMQQGSFGGNLARAAGQGFESIGHGIEELLGVEGADEAGAAFRAREAASARSAPWATAIGGAAPDVAAGVGAALATGGTGLLPMLAAQAAAGGTTGLLRSAESGSDRAANAALGAATGLLGEIIGPAGAKAIQAGSKMANAVTQRSTGRLAREAMVADEGLAAQQAARQAGQQPAGSVGAARTPEALRDPGIAEETAAMDVDELTGATIKNPGLEAEREAAMSHGYKDPWYAGTRQGSQGRVLGSLQELNPARDITNASVLNSNSALKAKLTGKALGLGDNEARDIISDADLLQAEKRIETGFEHVAKELPNIGNSEYLRALDKIEMEIGAVGADMGEEIIAGIKSRLRKNESAYVTPKAFMRDVQKLTAKMAKAYKDQDPNSGDMLAQAVNYLYDLGERATKNAPSSHGAHGRDPEIVSKDWAAVRREHQVLRMVLSPGVRSPTGEINSQALYRQLTKPRRNGGFGIEGPPQGSDLRPLFDVVRYDRGANMKAPQTGVRAAMQMARLPLGIGLGTQAAISAGDAVGSLWD